jgi:hypothetical protein
MSITGHSKSVDSQFTSFVFNKDSRFWSTFSLLSVVYRGWA